MLLRCVLPIGLLCVAAVPALATQRHVDLNFTASNFTPVYSGPEFTALPQSVVTGHVVFDYDTDLVAGGDRFAPTSVDLTINGYSYSPANVLVQAGDDYLGLYGTSTIQGPLLGTDIFGLFVYNFFSGNPNPPYPGYFDYSVNEPVLFSNRFDSVTVAYSRQISDAGAVPEPATWLMLITGFGLVGTALRRRKGSFA